MYSVGPIPSVLVYSVVLNLQIITFFIVYKWYLECSTKYSAYDSLIYFTDVENVHTVHNILLKGQLDFKPGRCTLEDAVIMAEQVDFREYDRS